MLPTLLEFAVESPAFIRKINSLTSWNPEGGDSNLAERARLATEKLFKEPNDIYSLWLVNTDQELYSVVASLSANRSPKNQNIDFIWIAESELQDLSIQLEQTLEGSCLQVQALHFNARIDKGTAEKLCYSLMRQGREAKRCKKTQTTLILEHQKQRGCKATESNFQSCECEKQRFSNC